MNHRTTSSNLAIPCFVLVVIALLGAPHAAQSSPTPPSPPPGGSAVAAFYPRGRDRPHNYEILNEEVHYSGWRRVIRRSVGVIADDGDGGVVDDRGVIHFDVIDQARASGGAVVVFAWNSTSKTATIIREYMPGPHRVLSGLAAGIVEDGKHSSPQEEGGGSESPSSLLAARFELEEEW